MSHERYYLEDRLRVPFSHTIPSEPRHMGVKDDVNGQALVVEDVNSTSVEIAQLKERGLIFPIETAQGITFNPIDVQTVQELPKDIQG